MKLAGPHPFTISAVGGTVPAGVWLLSFGTAAWGGRGDRPPRGRAWTIPNPAMFINIVNTRRDGVKPATVRNTGLTASGKRLLADLDGIAHALHPPKHRINRKTQASPTSTGQSSDVLGPTDDLDSLHVLDPGSEESDASDVAEIEAEDRYNQFMYEKMKQARRGKRKRKHRTGENHGYCATLCPPYFKKGCLLRIPPVSNKNQV